MSHTDVTLDVRGLPPPEPMERCLDQLAVLDSGQSLHLLIDREPHPLFAILERQGYAWTCAPDNGHFRVTIRSQ